MKITEQEIIELYNMFKGLRDRKENKIIMNYSDTIDIEHKNGILVTNCKYTPNIDPQWITINYAGDFTNEKEYKI